MLVTIDGEFCESAGECVRQVPQVFFVGPDDATRTIDGPVPAELEDDVLLAVDSCPRLAIVVASDS